ncbi:MAG: translocation/assembly module TamB domain-containing protein [Betaproteobacteria bacterium]
MNQPEPPLAPEPAPQSVSSSAAKPRRSVLRRLLWLGPLGVLPVMLASLAGAVAALWWWSGQEGSLGTSLSWWAPPGLQAEGVSGSLRQGGSAQRLRWQQGSPALEIEAEQVQLQWSLGQLLEQWAQGHPDLHLPLLSAQRLRIKAAASATASAAPTRLALPLDVALDHIHVAELIWQGSSEVAVQDVDASYHYQGQQHRLQLRHLRLAQGSYSGQAIVQDRAPLQVQASLEGQLQARLSQGRSLPLTLQASAKGPLERIELQARLTGADATQAQVDALITAWHSQVLAQADVSLAQLDLALLWPQAPRTRLSGKVQVTPQGEQWRFTAQLSNGGSGPINEGLLPLDALELSGHWQAGQWLLERADGRLGTARLQAEGTVGSNAARWQGQAKFEGLQPSRIDSRWPAQTVDGQGQASLAGRALRFELSLNGRSERGTERRPNPPAWGLQQAWARGQWSEGVLELDSAGATGADARLDASGRWQVASQSGSGQLQLQAPGLKLQTQASWPLNQQAGQLELSSSDMQASLRWLRALPGLPANAAQLLGTLQARGRSDLRLQWQAGLREAQVQSRTALASLAWGAGAQARTLSEVTLELQGPLSAAWVKASLHYQDGGRRWRAQGSGQAMLGDRLQELSKLADLTWQGRIEQLHLELEDTATGRWQADSLAALALQGRSGQWRVDPGRLRLQAPGRADATPVELAWSELSGQGASQWVSTGTLAGLPLAWLALIAGPTLTHSPWSGDLIFDGRWDLRLGRSLQLDARLSRRSGDLNLQGEQAQGQNTTLAAGVRVAELQLRGQGEDLSLDLRWDSERAGSADGQLRTRLQRLGEAWSWPEQAPLQGQLNAQLPRLGLWSALAPPGWRLRGSIGARLQISGNRAQPQWGGELQADDLALRSVVEGIELGRGRLRARLDGQQLLIDELMLRGGGDEGGSITARGQVQWPGGKPRLEAQAQIDRLRASVRSDRRVTLSGQLKAVMAGLPAQQPIDISGALRIDQARITLPEEDRPQLGGDVQVRRAGPVATPAVAAAAANKTPLLKLAVGLDLGSDFALEGRGLQTRLQGQLQISSDGLQAPRVQGQLSSAQGQFKAYGQQLTIERGQLRFSGPVDNPALDILALRPNLTQRVGVQVSGSALLPRVSLYAEPDLPEAEKLAWLVLGRANTTGGAESAMLQQAALALLGNRSGQSRGSLANALGLDEIGLRGAGTQADGSNSGAGLALGKRLSSNFYALYESGLGGGLGTLYLFYDLSRKLTVRAQTGSQTAIDLIYTLSFD